MAKAKPRILNANIPDTLALLGNVVELDIEKNFGSQWLTWEFHLTGTRSRYLCSNAAGNTLYIFPTKTTKADDKDLKKRRANIVKTANLFATWQQDPASKYSIFKLKEVPLINVGKANHIVYKSDKWGESDIYIHNFDSRMTVYTPKQALTAINPPPIIMIKGTKLKVTKRGIEG